MDRIDLRIDVLPVARAELMGTEQSVEASAPVAQRVRSARRAAAARWAEHGWPTNAEVPGSLLRSRPWRPGASVLAPVERALDAGRLTARGLDRVLRVAWTLADLSGRDGPDRTDVAEALFYRSGRDTAGRAA